MYTLCYFSCYIFVINKLLLVIIIFYLIHYRFIFNAAGSNFLKKDTHVIMGLWPGTRYVIRVSAVNSAGSTTAEYIVATQQFIGGTRK